MNLQLLRGLLDSLTPAGLTALRPLSPGGCCVCGEQTPPDTGRPPTA